MSNTTLMILSISGAPHPLYRIFFGKKGVTDLGGTPPPLYGIFPGNLFSKRAKNCVFCSKTPDFGPKNRLRIWGVPPSPPLRIFFSAKRGLRIWGVPPPLYGQNLHSSIWSPPLLAHCYATVWHVSVLSAIFLCRPTRPTRPKGSTRHERRKGEMSRLWHTNTLEGPIGLVVPKILRVRWVW